MPDPPNPLKKGDFEKSLVPPFLRGVRGDLALIVTHKTGTTFDIFVNTNCHCLSPAPEETALPSPYLSGII